MQNTNQAKTFKLALVGDTRVGKTAYIERFKTGAFRKEHMPTLGVDVSPLGFLTNHGPIIANVWDCAGDEKFRGLSDGYWIGADAAIIMFDVTNPDSYTNVAKWYKDIRLTCGNIPIVLVGNKVDTQHRKVPAESITFHKERNTVGVYFDVSAKSTYNQEKPFLAIFRFLLKKGDLAFVDA